MVWPSPWCGALRSVRLELVSKRANEPPTFVWRAQRQVSSRWSEKQAREDAQATSDRGGSKSSLLARTEAAQTTKKSSHKKQPNQAQRAGFYACSSFKILHGSQEDRGVRSQDEARRKVRGQGANGPYFVKCSVIARSTLSLIGTHNKAGRLIL